MFLQVQTESSEVARRVLAVHHCGRRDGHEDLVTCSQLKQAALVHRVKGVFCVWSPTFGPHSLQQLNRPQVGGFLIDALNQLVAYAVLISSRWERGSGSTPGSTGSSGRPGVREGVRWPASCCADGRRSSGWPSNVQGGGRTGAGLVEGWSVECHLRKREKMDFRLA